MTRVVEGAGWPDVLICAQWLNVGKARPVPGCIGFLFRGAGGLGADSQAPPIVKERGAACGVGIGIGTTDHRKRRLEAALRILPVEQGVRPAGSGWGRIGTPPYAKAHLEDPQPIDHHSPLSPSYPHLLPTTHSTNLSILHHGRRRIPTTRYRPHHPHQTCASRGLRQAWTRRCFR